MVAMTTIYIFLAKYLIIVPVIAFVFYIWRQPRSSWKQMAVFAGVAAVVSYIIALTVGHLYYDPRPFVIDGVAPLIPHAPDNGFPSDHALLAFVLAAIGWFWNKRLGVLLGVFAILVAVGRVAVGVHHPIDVIGSALIAIVVVSAVYKIVRGK
jgi:undecaprenyl-diphosphatase